MQYHIDSDDNDDDEDIQDCYEWDVSDNVDEEDICINYNTKVNLYGINDLTEC